LLTCNQQSDAMRAVQIVKDTVKGSRGSSAYTVLIAELRLGVPILLLNALYIKKRTLITTQTCSVRPAQWNRSAHPFLCIRLLW
jgi:hypothetical protein